MNQILDYNPISDGDNRGRGGNNPTDKLAKVYAILLIIFAICLMGIGAYNIIQNKSDEKPGEVAQTKANITTNIEGTTLTISVSHDKNLNKLIYNWNTTSEKNIAIETGKTFKTTIEIPSGENTLNIQVIDENGVKTEYSEPITSDEGVDIIKPTIKYEITEDKKIKITAKDETEIDFITYRWNDEEEKKIEAEDGEFQIVEEIEIKKGENNLTIVAVDKSNNTDSFQQVFTGLMQPNIQVVLSEDKSKLVVTCTHENGISKIEYTLNEKPFAAELQDNPKEVQFEQPLDEGNNTIILTVTSIDGTSTTFGGQCTYTPETQVTIE